MEFISNGYNDTFEIGKSFAKDLKAGDAVMLIGDLGAGKTAFTSGVAAGFGISDYVSSPTFTIVNEYNNGNVPLYHFDLYRLNDEDELYDIGIDEYLESDGICIFEWPQLVMPIADSFYCIYFEKKPELSDDYRKIIITKSGNKNEHISN